LHVGITRPQNPSGGNAPGEKRKNEITTASRDRQRADEAERTARDQQYDLQDATAALEKAQRYGDAFAIERATRNLKRLT